MFLTYLVHILASLVAVVATWIIALIRRKDIGPYGSKIGIALNFGTFLPILVPIMVAILIARDTLRLNFGHVLLTIGGSILITIVLFVIFGTLGSRVELSMRAHGKDKYASLRETIARAEQGEKRAEQLRRTPPKVYRCGICGKTNPSNQYILSDSGLFVCTTCHGYGYGNDPDIMTCPSCGYRLDPGDNRIYFEEHRCAHCNTAL